MTPAGRLLLIRHGRTAWNGSRYQGWEETHLDAEGRTQAREVARSLSGTRIDAIWSSPLARAVETVRPLAGERGMPVVVVDLLRELNYGVYQGVAKRGHRLSLVEHHLVDPLPGGESLSDLHARAVAAAALLHAEIAAGRTIAIAGHRGFNRMLFGVLRGQRAEVAALDPSYRPANGSILDVRFTRGPDRPAVRAAHLVDGEASARGRTRTADVSA